MEAGCYIELLNPCSLTHDLGVSISFHLNDLYYLLCWEMVWNGVELLILLDLFPRIHWRSSLTLIMLFSLADDIYLIFPCWLVACPYILIFFFCTASTSLNLSHYTNFYNVRLNCLFDSFNKFQSAKCFPSFSNQLLSNQTEIARFRHMLCCWVNLYTIGKFAPCF